MRRRRMRRIWREVESLFRSSVRLFDLGFVRLTGRGICGERGEGRELMVTTTYLWCWIDDIHIKIRTNTNKDQYMIFASANVKL